MAVQQLTASALIEASATDVYAIIADYHEGHTLIIPRPPFVSLEVEKGGRGAGTVVRVEIKIMGKVQSYHATVSEPEPGRVLVETNDNGYVTSFTVEPRANGSQAYVTIATDLGDRAGVPGKLERWMVTRMLRPVYIKELELLAAVAGRKASTRAV
jgi:hypothetical protein